MKWSSTMTEAQKLAWDAITRFCGSTPELNESVTFTRDEFRLMLTDACGKPVDKADSDRLLSERISAQTYVTVSAAVLAETICECMYCMSFFVKKDVDLDQLDLRDKTVDQIFSAVFGDKDCDTNIKINGHAIKKLISRILTADPFYTEVVAEQRRGLEKYGGIKHDDEHEKRDWRIFIHDHLDQAHNDHNYRSQLIKIAGLCKSAVESLDRKQKT